MEIECVNPELRRDQIAKGVSCSKGTLKPYRHDNYMLSHYGVPLNSHKEDNSFQIQKLFVISNNHNSNLEHDLKTTSIDVKKISKKRITNNKKIER